MGSNKSQKHRALASALSQNTLQQHKKKAITLLAGLASSVSVAVLFPFLFRRSMHTSRLSGLAWMIDLLSGHPDQFYAAMGMNKNVFGELVSELERYGGLQDSRNVSVIEQLGIFCYTVVTGLTT